MKMGNTLSPWHYDAAIRHALRNTLPLLRPARYGYSGSYKRLGHRAKGIDRRQDADPPFAHGRKIKPAATLFWALPAFRSRVEGNHQA
jgi:hypothetical protein